MLFLSRLGAPLLLTFTFLLLSSVSFLFFLSVFLIHILFLRFVSVSFSHFQILFTSCLPASHVPGENGIPDPIVLSDDELVALNALLANELTGSTVSVHPLERSHYHHV